MICYSMLRYAILYYFYCTKLYEYNFDTTTKHYMSCALRKTTLEIGSHDVELVVSN